MVLYPYDEIPGDPFRNNGGGGGNQMPPPAPPPAPLAVGPNGGGNGGGGGGLRPTFNFANAPDFHAPVFHQPTFAEAQNEPGYQFRLNAGSNALERSAAARGALRTGGTLKDVLEYGQNFATQEYGNVYNRALSAFDRDYRGAFDTYRSEYDPWALMSGAEIQAGLAAFAAQHHGGGGGGGGPIAPPPDPNAPAPPPTWPGGGTEFRKPGYGGGNYGMPPDWHFPEY